MITDFKAEREVIKLNKRFISMIVALVMFSMLLCGLPSSAAAEGSISITADKAFAKKGETVTYTVSANGLDDIRGFQLGLMYDTSDVSYEKDSVTLAADLFTDYSGFTETPGSLGFAFAFDEPTSYTGLIASFSMTVSEECSLGKIGVSVSKLLVTGDIGEEIAVSCSVDDVCAVSEYNAEFYVAPDKTELYTGDTVTYKISMTDVTVKGMQFAAEYDDSCYELLDVESTGAYQMIQKTDGNKVGFVFYSNEDTVISGELVSLSFKVKHIDSSSSDKFLLKISGVKAVSSADVLDLSYAVLQEPVSLLKSEKVEINFIPDKLMAGANETISYTASVSGIESMRGFQTALKYDVSKLELIETEQLSVMAMADAAFETDVDGTVGLVCVFTEAVQTTGGELARLTFRVKENVANGFADMSVLRTKISADGIDFIDADYYKDVEEVFVYGGQKAVISAVPSKDIVIPGETFEYSFDLSSVNEFRGMQFKLLFDSEALELISITNGSVLNNAVVKTVRETSDGVIQGMINYKDGYTGGGNLFIAVFAAKMPDALICPQMNLSDVISDDYITYDISPVFLYPDEPAAEVINAIEAIGEVDLTDGDLIQRARRLYDALEPEIQNRVSNYTQLIEAESIYAELYEALPVFECEICDGTVKLTQNKDCGEKLTLYIAQYNSSGAVTAVESTVINGSSDISYERTLQTAEVKCFIWNDSMQPFEDVLYKP